MKKVTMYEANDGRLLFSEEDCIKHEEKLIALKKANELFESGGSLKDALAMIGIDAEIGPITKHTSINYGHNANNIDYDGQIYITGIRKNKGKWVTLSDFIKMAEVDIYG